MGELIYPACVRELYESEIFGEAGFLALIAVARNARDKYHFGTLLQLETETKARLRPLLYKHDIDLAEDMDLGDIAGIVELYGQGSWPEFTAAIIPVVEGFLARFKQIEAVGPEEDRQILGAMITHEAAILRWLEMESGGRGAGSLDAVIGQLHNPLPTPPGYS